MVKVRSLFRHIPRGNTSTLTTQTAYLYSTAVWYTTTNSTSGIFEQISINYPSQQQLLRTQRLVAGNSHLDDTRQLDDPSLPPPTQHQGIATDCISSTKPTRCLRQTLSVRFPAPHLIQSTSRLTNSLLLNPLLPLPSARSPSPMTAGHTLCKAWFSGRTTMRTSLRPKPPSRGLPEMSWREIQAAQTRLRRRWWNRQ